MPGFDTLQPGEQRKILFNIITAHCPGAVTDGDTLYYSVPALRVRLEFGQAYHREGRFTAQMLFILSHDWFDEDLVEPYASLGNSLEDAMKMCAAEFSENMLKPLLDALEHPGQDTITAEIIHQKYLFHVPEKHAVLHRGKGKAVDPWEIVREKIPEYLGTKRVYWIKLFSGDMVSKEICEVTINGILYQDLTDLLYQEIISRPEREVSVNKLFMVLVQDESTWQPCPFTKQNVGDLAFLALGKLTDIKDDTEKEKVFREIAKLCPDYSIAVELIAFLPEIMAQEIVNYRDSEGLIPVFDYGKPEFELKKSQVRSYGYMTDAVRQYLKKYQPGREELYRILRISGKFEVMSRALQEKNMKVEDLRLSQLVYFVNQNYHVW